MRPLILALLACSAGTSHAVSFTQNDVTLDINGTINGFYVVREPKSIHKATGASMTTTNSALTNGLLPGTEAALKILVTPMSVNYQLKITN